jgi:hypothetical protein
LLIRKPNTLKHHPLWASSLPVTNQLNDSDICKERRKTVIFNIRRLEREGWPKFHVGLKGDGKRNRYIITRAQERISAIAERRMSQT